MPEVKTQQYRVISDCVPIYETVVSHYLIETENNQPKEIDSLQKNEIIDIVNTEKLDHRLFGQLQNGNWVMLKNFEIGFTSFEQIFVIKHFFDLSLMKIKNYFFFKKKIKIPCCLGY